MGETTPRPPLPPTDAGMIRDWVARLLADLLELFGARMIAFCIEWNARRVCREMQERILRVIY